MSHRTIVIVRTPRGGVSGSLIRSCSRRSLLG
jgi:hypothetical protein